MKIPKNEKGGVLITVLAMLIVMAAVSGSILSMVTQEYILSKRTLAWQQALFTAEAGVESSWNELNKLTGINTNSTFMSGWTYLGTNTWQSTNATVNPLSGIEASSSYSVTLNTSAWAIVSTGTASSPAINQTVSRTIIVAVNPTHPFEWALLAKESIDFVNANPIIDSWDSDATGSYDVNNRKANGYVGCNGTVISGAGSWTYGSVMTGVGGSTDSGLEIKDISTDKQRMYPNVESNGLEVYIPDVADPWSSASPPNSIPASTGHGSSQVITKDLGGATFQCGDGTYDLAENLTVIGPGTFEIWVNSFKGAGGQSAEVTSSNGANVVIYSNGDIDATGNSSTDSTAAQLHIYGLPSCTSVKLGGNSQTSAAIYAPSAAVDLQGTADVFGSIVGNTISFVGNPNFHYDEALQNTGNVIGFSLVSYREN